MYSILNSVEMIERLVSLPKDVNIRIRWESGGEAIVKWCVYLKNYGGLFSAEVVTDLSPHMGKLAVCNNGRLKLVLSEVVLIEFRSEDNTVLSYKRSLHGAGWEAFS